MKTISLFYTGNGSNKEYHLQIESRAGGFIVNYANGRRGGTLARGCKSSCPVPLDVAEKLFAKIVKSKLADGYTKSPDGKPFGGDAVKLAEVLPQPTKTLIPFAGRAQLECADGLLLRKYDGETGDRRLENVPVKMASPRRGNVRLLGEFMRTEISGHFYTAADRAMFRDFPQGWFAVWRLMEIDGQNVLDWSTRRQWQLLGEMQRHFPPGMILAERVQNIGGVIGRGAEGVCYCDWAAPFGSMLACKVEQIYLCTVTAIGGTQAATIRVHDSGAICKVKLGGGAIDQVRIGSVLRIAGLGLTDKGCIRQPTKCREFLVAY